MDDFAKFEGWGVIWTGFRCDDRTKTFRTYLAVYDTEDEARREAGASRFAEVLRIAPMSELLSRCLAEPK